MKKTLTATLALLLSLYSFAANQKLKFSDITIGMPKQEFTQRFSTSESGNTLSFYADFESLGNSYVVAFFINNQLEAASVRTDNGCPSSFRQLSDNYTKLRDKVCQEPDIKSISSTDEFLSPFSSFDDPERQYQALILGYYRLQDVFENYEMRFTLSVAPQGVISLAIERSSRNSNAGHNSADDIHTPGQQQTNAQNESNANSDSPQPDKHALEFCGNAITGSAADFANQFSDNKQFSIVDTSNPDQICLNGIVDGQRNCEIYFCNDPNTHLLAKIIVYYPLQNTWKDLEGQYKDLRSRYDQFEGFKKVNSDRGDYWSGGNPEPGQELEAVDADRCYFITNYRVKNTHKVTLYISKYRRVSVVYEVNGFKPSKSDQPQNNNNNDDKQQGSDATNIIGNLKK